MYRRLMILCFMICCWAPYANSASSFKPTIGVGGYGFAVAVWEAYGQNGREIRSSTFIEGTWAPPVQISKLTSTQSARNPILIVSPYGDAVTMYLIEDSIGPTTFLQAAILRPCSGWETTNISNINESVLLHDYHMVLDDYSGVIVAIWTSNIFGTSVIRSAYGDFFTGQWTLPITISN